MEDFWRIEEGKVISTTIDKYIYVIIKERFDDLIVLNYSRRETVQNVSKIKHELIRESLVKTGITGGVEITTLADIPSEGSGLGSSSSVTVGLLNAFYTYKGVQVTAERLAREACEIEIEILGKPIGKQDQYAAAYGGLNEIIFHADGTVALEEISLSPRSRLNFGSSILMFYTNITRSSCSVLSEQKTRTPQNFDTLRKMRNQAGNVKMILQSGKRFKVLGEILDEAWVLKRQLASNISNSQIDQMYQSALEAGATGGKISGAGGGGFLMLYVPREEQNSVREALKDYRELPFMLDPCGTRIMLNIVRNYWS